MEIVNFQEEIEEALAAIPAFGPGAKGITILRDTESISSLLSITTTKKDTVTPCWGAVADPSAAEGFTLVMAKDGKAIGQMTVLLEHSPKWTHPILETVFVDRHYRGRGVARQLADAAIEIIEQAVSSANAKNPGVCEYFDPFFSGETNEGGEAVMALMSDRMRSVLTGLLESPEPT